MCSSDLVYFYDDSLAVYGDTSLYLDPADGLAVDTWVSVRITRQASKDGVRKFAIFVNGTCLGAVDDHVGRLRFTGGKGVLLADDADESYPTNIADVRLYDTVMNPEPCPLTPS